MKKLHPILIGSLQAVGTFIYVGLVSLVMLNVEHIFDEEPEGLSVITILLLFVVSAAVTGLLVFGYPAYVALKGDFKRGLYVAVVTIATLALGPLSVLLFNLFK